MPAVSASLRGDQRFRSCLLCVLTFLRFPTALLEQIVGRNALLRVLAKDAALKPGLRELAASVRTDGSVDSL